MKAISGGLLGRVAEHARELAINAQNPGIPYRRQYDRVGRQLEQLVEISRLPEQLFVGSVALAGVRGKTRRLDHVCPAIVGPFGRLAGTTEAAPKASGRCQ